MTDKVEQVTNMTDKTVVEGAVVIDQIQNKDDIPTMRDLNRYVTKKYAVDWKGVGLELNLQLSTLKNIQQNVSQQVEDRFEDVLDKWLQLTPKATWRMLEVALTNVRRQQLGLDPVDDVYASDSAVMATQCVTYNQLTRKSSVLDSLNDYLQDVYKETRYTSHTEWPPDQPKSIVSNTLIHYKDKRTERELLDISKSQRGASSIDKITFSHSSRVTKSIASIFESPDQKFILIEGAPGIGKTVLAREIAYQWACGKILIGKRLFMLVMRNPDLHDVDSINHHLISSFSCDYLSGNEVDAAVDELRKSRGQNIVFVIDGFDECPNSCQLYLLIKKLIEHKILPKLTVVITSRPHASISLHPFADQRIEILGFAKRERDEYITESLKSFPEMKSYLEKYLKLQPVINSIIHIPLHLAVLLYLFKQNSIPETLTELNEQFVIHTIYRHLERQQSQTFLPFDHKIEKISCLPRGILKITNQLSQLALMGLGWSRNPLWQKQLVFTYDEVKAVCPEIDNVPNVFGLLQAVRHHAARGPGTTVSFNFLHLTMQEFLAAYYVSTLTNEEQLDIAFNYDFSDYVWLMYVGIVGIKSDSFIQHQNTTMKQYKLLKSNVTNKLLFLFQCYLETKQSVFPDYLFAIFKDGNIRIHQPMQPCNVVSLINFMAKSNTQFKSFDIRNCWIADEGISILQRFFTDYVIKIANIEYVSLVSNGITSLWGTHSNDDFCNNSIEIATSWLLMIPCVDISYNMLKNKGISELFAPLHHNTTVRELNVSHNGLSDDGIKAISDSLRTNYTLRVLNIAGNSITNTGATEIANAMQINKSLSSLNVSKNKIEREGIMDILKAGTKTRVLKRLDCIFNTLSHSDFVAVTSYNRDENVVQELNTSWNRIVFAVDDECKYMRLPMYEYMIRSPIHTVMCYGYGHDAQLCSRDDHCMEPPYYSYSADPVLYNKVICGCIDSHVETLHLKEIEDFQENFQGHLAITVKSMLVNKALTKLYVEYFSIDDDEVQAIIKCLDASNLLELNLSCNLFFSGALKKVIETITHNTCLRKLDISSNVVSDDDIDSITVCLKENKVLKELIMSHTEITDKGALMIAEAVVDTGLHVLNVSYCNLSDCGIEAIGDSLKHNKLLQELNVSFNHKVTRNSVLQFLKCIATNTTLVKLNVDGLEIKLLDIVDCLKGNTTIQDIGFGTCDWYDLAWIMEKEYKEWIVSATTFLHKITIGYSIHNTAAYNSAVNIADYLLRNKLLQEFHFGFPIELQLVKSTNYCNELEHPPHNDILDAAIYMMIQSIKVSTTLTRLRINHDPFTSESATVISDCITYNTSIQELELLSVSMNTCKEEVRIFKAIINNKTIKKLKISYHSLDDDCMSVISQLLKNNTTLQCLDIEQINIHSKHLAVIIDSLKSNNTLLELYLSLPKDELTIANKLATMLQSNLFLNTISISCCEHENVFLFCQVILSALYNNKSMKKLILPWCVKLGCKEMCVLQNEIENIKLGRQSQAIPVSIGFSEDIIDLYCYNYESSEMFVLENHI